VRRDLGRVLACEARAEEVIRVAQAPVVPAVSLSVEDERATLELLRAVLVQSSTAAARAR